MSKFSSLTQLDRDYIAVIEKIKEIIPNLTKDWTDFSDSDVGMFLVQTMAAIKDMQALHFDYARLENYLSTVKERKNLISLLEPVGYSLGSYKCTTIVISWTGNEPPVGTTFNIVGDSTPFVYLGRADDYSAADQQLTLVQGTLNYWPSDATVAFRNISDTNGNQVIALVGDNDNSADLIKIAVSDPEAKIAIDGTSFISRVKPDGTFYTSADGPEYSDSMGNMGYIEVTDLVSSSYRTASTEKDSNGNPKIYRLFVDRDNKTYLQFFNIDVLLDFSGIRLYYLVTDGYDVPVGLMVDGTEVESTEGTGNILYVNRGSDPETLEKAKRLAPNYVRAVDRAITIEDYEELTYNWLSSSSKSEVREFSNLGVCAVDYYRNEQSDHPISDFPAVTDKPYVVGVYAVAENGVEIADNVTAGNVFPLGTDIIHTNYVYAINMLGNSGTDLNDYLNTKRIAGIRCYINHVDGDAGLEIWRFVVKIRYGRRRNRGINEDKIEKALSEYYRLNNDSFGRTVHTSDIIQLVLDTDPEIYLDPVTPVQMYAYADYTGEDYGAGTSISPTFITGDVSSTLNRPVIYGGVAFEEI